MKSRLVKTGAAAAAAVMILSSCAAGGKSSGKALELWPYAASPGGATEPGLVINKREAPAGMVAAADGISYGLSTAGLLSYTGANYGRGACYGWKGVCFVAAGEGFTAGLLKDGTVVVAGSKELSEKTAEWTKVAKISCTKDSVIGLTEDGRLLSTGGELSFLENIGFIAAGPDYFVAIGGNGGVYTAGNAPDTAGIITNGAMAIAAGADHIALIDDRGVLVSTREGDPLSGAANCAQVFAGDGWTAVIDREGTLYTDCEAVKSLVTNETPGFSEGPAGVYSCRDAAWFAASKDHALIMTKSGAVLSSGENSYLQCKTEYWQLRPFEKDGYVFGIAPKTEGENGYYISTGDKVAIEGGRVLPQAAAKKPEASGTAVILGDVDRNGEITKADLELLQSALAGKQALEEDQKQAADVLRNGIRTADAYSPAPNAADAEQLRYATLGYTEIDQYGKHFTYFKEITDWEVQNTDTCGFMRLANTNIDDPLMYGPDWFYHYHAPNKASSAIGSLYLYFDRPTQNYVVTAHNWRGPSAGLNQLHKIQDQYAKDYGQYRNRLWEVNLFGSTGLWEVFAMYEEKPESSFKSSQYYNTTFSHSMESMSEEEIAKWIAYQNERTELDYTLDVRTDDRFLTVLTCADTHAESDRGGRIYFFLRLVDGH